MERISQLFRLLQSANPRVAARAALFLFTHPMPTAIFTKAEKRLAAKARAKLGEATREDLRACGYRIATWRFATPAPERKGSVLMVHGWTSAAAFMTAPVDRLLARGYDVIAFDMPAHGKSSGRRAVMMDCVLATVAVASRYGPIDTVIAHSFGGPVTTMAVASELSPALHADTQLIFIASPNRLADVTEQFARQIGLSKEAQAIFEAELVAPFGGSLEAMDANVLLKGCGNRLTILHSRDDTEVGFDAAERYAGLGERVRLQPLDGLGHRRILHAQPSVDALMASLPN